MKLKTLKNGYKKTQVVKKKILKKNRRNLKLFLILLFNNTINKMKEELKKVDMDMKMLQMLIFET